MRCAAGVVGVLWVVRLAAACPIGYLNMRICSGHGHCATNVTTIGLDESCVCDDGFSGPDCSQRICPSGRAWVDFATANDTAHADYVECSNMGYCDRVTGECICREGLSGSACQRLLCPTVVDELGRVRECRGAGKCLSMREAATQLDLDSVSWSTNYDEWDADAIYGCACDEGFTGFDCSERECPRGDDPLTPGVDEVQLIDCRCTGDASWCNGTIALHFRGQRTDPIPYDATPELVEYYLEALSTITDVDLRFHTGGRDAVFCDGQLGTTVVVTFLAERGDVPSLNVSIDSSSHIAATVFADGASSALRPGISSVTGTKEWVECSNHGTCDRATGMCGCYTGWTTSDGRGNEGPVGDCGALASNYSDYQRVFFYNAANSTESPCPIAKPRWAISTLTARAVCSGVGVCLPDRTCNCSIGYGGHACEFRICPTGHAWWDTAAMNGGSIDAHRSGAVCSNRGTCDLTSGTCNCETSGYKLFDGEACELMACPDDGDNECGKHGRCATMAEFAKNGLVLSASGAKLIVRYSEPWDAYKVRGCLCDASEGVWDYNTSSTSYRGPFAYAYTDWTGYTCEQAFCPTGDNPFTWGVNEVQAINCTARGGSFNVTFRGAHESVLVPWWAEAAKLELELEKVATIRDVTVSYTSNNASSNKTICGDGQFVTVEFESERGDLPLLVVDDSQLDGAINVTEIIRGTKEDVECSAAGICNRDNGQCTCLDGFYSGRDVVPFRYYGAAGQRGDCSFRHSSTKGSKWWNALYEYSYSFVLLRGEAVTELTIFDLLNV